MPIGLAAPAGVWLHVERQGDPKLDLPLAEGQQGVTGPGQIEKVPVPGFHVRRVPDGCRVMERLDDPLSDERERVPGAGRRPLKVWLSPSLAPH